MMKSLKAGFTLAEVLTTLMVIGVVAAMTIPTLMNSTGEQQARVACKKAASVLSQATQLLVAREVECSIGTADPSLDLAVCMSQVISGSLDSTNDTITTPDGIIYKFFAPTPTSATSLEGACGANFIDWNGGGNCGVVVDTNGLAKGTRTLTTATFSATGFNADPTSEGNTDVVAFSLASAGVRPVGYSGAANKSYDYMFGKTPSASDITNPSLCTSGTATACTSDSTKGTVTGGTYYYAATCGNGYTAASFKTVVSSCPAGT